ncbi:MAG TPA: cyclic nucleotide-binding domain-containing protein [Polyangiaceae bacterium]
MPVDGGVRSEGRVERVLALRSFPGLAEVDPKHLALLADVAKERVFTKGTALIVPGTPVRAMHLIRRGDVAVLVDGIARRSYAAGALVGGIAALTRDPKGQHVVATTDTRTFEIDRDDFSDVLEESFSLLHSALRGMLRTALDARRAIPENAGFAALPMSEEAGRASSELGIVERAMFVRRLMTYGSARVEALAELAREMTVLRVSAGTELFRLGEAAPYSLLVHSGVVACETGTAQRFRLGPDSVVGGIDSIAGEPRWYSAVAETDLVALRADTAHLMDVIEDHPDMGLDMLRSAARILAELQEKVYRAVGSTPSPLAVRRDRPAP